MDEGFLRKRDQSSWLFNECILKLLRHSLTHNIFDFQDNYYLQVHEVVMGTCCAPLYVNLYLRGQWERSLFSDDLASVYLCHVLTWHRYIDNNLMIWTGTPNDLPEFMWIFTYSSNSKFTKEKISFLGVENVVQDDETKLYGKETAGDTILKAHSAHSSPLIGSIPYSEYLRLCRNCTNVNNFENEMNFVMKDY